MADIGAIILAAGMSKRMGQPKLFLPLRGKPLFHYSLEIALRQHLNPILFIAGEHAEAFLDLAADLREIEFIRNTHYQKGMSESIKLGISRMKDRAEAAFIFLADQPFVPDLAVQALIQQYQMGIPNGIKIVRPFYNGTPGHPILVHKSLFPEFLELEGDQGGKEIIKKYRKKTLIVKFEHSFWGMDIDTVEDYQKSSIIARHHGIQK